MTRPATAPSAAWIAPPDGQGPESAPAYRLFADGHPWRLDDESLTVEALSDFTPRNIEQALAAMQTALRFFHRRNDYRAVFLHMYYIITRNVRDEIKRPTDPDRPLFLDPGWMSRLAGKFATLYFRSLKTFQGAADQERAWKLAHGMALEKRSTVLQDMVLGITAHIKYDLAVAIAANIRSHGDERRPGSLFVRKRDHDSANTLLKRSIQEIKRSVPREYGGGDRGLPLAGLPFDELLAISIVRYHREKVWWDAMELLSCKDAAGVDQVMQRLNEESVRVAERLAGASSFMVVVLRKLARGRRRRNITECATG